MPPIRQYTFQHPPPPEPVRYVDNNPRPAKSPRHAAPPEVQPLQSNAYPVFGTRFAPPYSGPGGQRAPAPEYFPPVMPVWTSGPGVVGTGYGTSTTAAVVGLQQYDYSNKQCVKEEDGQPHYTWGTN